MQIPQSYTITEAKSWLALLFLRHDIFKIKIGASEDIV